MQESGMPERNLQPWLTIFSATNDGIFAWDADNFVIKDNYIHNLTREASNGHIDGFQTEGSKHGVIEHNTIKISKDQNACIALWDGRLDTDDILVENNFLAGAGFTIYAEDYSPSERILKAVNLLPIFVLSIMSSQLNSSRP